MSRSYKKVPGFSDSEGGSKRAYYLRVMNRRIRGLDLSDELSSIANGNSYRKFVDRYEYSDYSFRYFTPRELDVSWYGLKGQAYKAVRK
jgi:hypothetical protein